MKDQLPALDEIPTLKRAIEYLARANGINNPSAIEWLIPHAWRGLQQAYPRAELARAELELQALSDSLLQEVCTGGLVDPMPIGRPTYELLSFIFNNLIPTLEKYSAPALPITIEQLDHFWDLFHQGGAKTAELRFGQAWVTQHLPAGQVDPEVFYQQDDRAAYDLILKRYVGSKR